MFCSFVQLERYSHFSLSTLSFHFNSTLTSTYELSLSQALDFPFYATLIFHNSAGKLWKTANNWPHENHSILLEKIIQPFRKSIIRLSCQSICLPSRQDLDQSPITDWVPVFNDLCLYHYVPGKYISHPLILLLVFWASLKFYFNRLTESFHMN